MNLLLLGTGQLARALVNSVANTRYSCTTLPREYYPQSDTSALSTVLERYDGQTVIINTAAFTDVARAECEPELAMSVNYGGVVKLAYLARQHGALLVHFSTDYVFDGSGNRPWTESDQPKPLNHYGQSKLRGEQAILASGCRYLIIRTSWLHSPWQHNFLKTMLQLSQRHTELTVVSDQIGAPTSAGMIADFTLRAIERAVIDSSLDGLYHVTSCGEVSWFNYSCFIFKEAKELGLIDRVPNVIPIATRNYDCLVKRPLNSRLDSSIFSHQFRIELPYWHEGVLDTLYQLSVS